MGALTMEAVSERSGASKPVVYEHFANSEAVAVALLENYLQTMVELVDSRTRDAATLDEYLSIAIDTHFEFHREDRLVVRSITNGHSPSERLNRLYLELRDASVETFQDLLQQQGANEREAHVAGAILWEMITSSVYEFAMDDNAEAARETLKRMVLGAVRAVAPKTDRKPVTPAKILAKSDALRASQQD